MYSNTDSTNSTSYTSVDPVGSYQQTYYTLPSTEQSPNNTSYFSAYYDPYSSQYGYGYNYYYPSQSYQSVQQNSSPVNTASLYSTSRFENE